MVALYSIFYSKNGRAFKDNQHTGSFDEILRQIRSDYPAEHQIQIGDTYGMCARAARENLGPLLCHLSRHMLEAGLDR
jgi:hypothetical protein